MTTVIVSEIPEKRTWSSKETVTGENVRILAEKATDPCRLLMGESAILAIRTGVARDQIQVIVPP
jgi:hypothetical protein